MTAVNGTMTTEEPLERILAREWNQSLSPYEYYITPEFNRLIDAGWAWQRMSVKGRWILGWTEAGRAAARDCGLEPDGEETEDAAYQLGALVRVKEFNQRGLVTKITVEADGKRIYVVTCENFEVYALPHGDIEPA